MDRFNSLFDSQFIYALGWTIVHSFWQSLLVFMLLGVSLFLGKRARPEIRYWLAMAALICCLLISVKTFIYCYQDVVQASNLLTQLQYLSVSTNQNWWVATFKTINPWLDNIVLVWCIGFIFQGMRLAFDMALTQKLKHQSTSDLPEYWNSCFVGLAQKLGITQTVSFLHSSKVNIPSVVGHFKPVVLLPLGILTQLPQAQIEAIMLHELAHVKRQDYLVNILQNLVKVLFFFNPFVLAICNKIDIERENACDDLAVKTCGDPLIFANSLSRFADVTPLTNSAMAATKSKYMLLARVTRLFSKNATLSSGYERLIALGCVVMFGLTLNVRANNLPIADETPMDLENASKIEVTKNNGDFDNLENSHEVQSAEPHEDEPLSYRELKVVENTDTTKQQTIENSADEFSKTLLANTTIARTSVSKSTTDHFANDEDVSFDLASINTSALDFVEHSSNDSKNHKVSATKNTSKPAEDNVHQKETRYVQIEASSKETLVLNSATELEDKKHIIFTPVKTETLSFISPDRKWENVLIPYLSELNQQPNDVFDLSKVNNSGAAIFDLDPSKTLIAQISVSNLKIVPGYGLLTSSGAGESARYFAYSYSNKTKKRERYFSRFLVTAKVTILLVHADTYKFAGYGEKLISLHPKNYNLNEIIALRSNSTDVSNQQTGVPNYIIKNTWDVLINEIQMEISETISGIQTHETKLIPVDTKVSAHVSTDKTNFKGFSS